MGLINFLTPQYYTNPMTFGESASNVVEGYFDLKSSTTLKVISYATLIFPLVMLIAKIILRCTQAQPIQNLPYKPGRTVRMPTTPLPQPASSEKNDAYIRMLDVLKGQPKLTKKNVQDSVALETLQAQGGLPDKTLDDLIAAYKILNRRGIGLVEAARKVGQYEKEKGSAATFADFVLWLIEKRTLGCR